MQYINNIKYIIKYDLNLCIYNELISASCSAFESFCLSGQSGLLYDDSLFMSH